MSDPFVGDVVALVGDVVPPAILVAAPSPSDAVVDAWFVGTFHNLALPTELQNRLTAAQDQLKRALRALEK